MIDADLPLALGITSTPGAYAVLAGSGLSSSAGIKTGWEILKDLAVRLSLITDGAAADDPIAWYREKYSTDPDYSDVLQGLARKSAERVAILRAYFEPTDEERDAGDKVPTEAHRHLAALVSTGHIRLIITTNFDRLIEQALSEAGITPTVVASADDVPSAVPLAYSPCMLIKLHGDYLDSRLLNTRDELGAYDPRLADLVDRHLRDHGLVIVGWSAEWDTALRDLLAADRPRPFSSFWVARHSLDGRAADLAAAVDAHLIQVHSADAFFGRLRERVSALSSLTATGPLGVREVVATAKRWVLRAEDRVRLSDLVADLANNAKSEIGDGAAVAGPASQTSTSAGSNRSSARRYPWRAWPP